MNELFLTMVNRGISASWIVLVVLLLRVLLKKAPKWIHVLLWGVVAIRLVCPFSIESAMSLIPSAETIHPNIMTDPAPQIQSGIAFINNTINPIITDSLPLTPTVGANSLQIWIPIFTVIWAIGVVVLLAYTVVSFLLIHKKVRTAVLLKENVYQCEAVISPFVLGVIKPKIYLPFRRTEQEAEHILAHEQAHIRRRDHLWKPFGFLLLTLHWWNPLMWLAYGLLCRDIELACDQRVIKVLTTDQRADYSETLLACSVNRRTIAACPLAFGEVGVKERVKSVLNYKKPAFWILIVAIVALAVTSICFLTNPRGNRNDSAQIKPGLEIRSTGSDRSDVTIDAVSIHKDANNLMVLKIRWNNHSKSTICYGQPFQLARFEDGKWVELEAYNAWELPAYPVLPLSTEDTQFRDMNREYEFHISENYKVTEDGIYRFITDFHFGNDGTKKYNVWVDFSYKEPSSVSPIGGVSGSANVDFASMGYQHYQFKWEKDQAHLSLSMVENREVFSFSFSFLSSYLAVGTYKDDGTYIVLETDDGNYKYTFKKENDKLIFAADKSSAVSAYAYSPGAEAEACIPDGAVFEKVELGFEIDTIVFDIDQDGNEETCVLRYGPTFDLFTFTLSITENGKTEYFNIFHSEFYALAFAEQNGTLRLKGIPQGENPTTHYFDFVIENGNISLVNEGQSIPYWGQQGTDSPYAPKGE